MKNAEADKLAKQVLSAELVLMATTTLVWSFNISVFQKKKKLTMSNNYFILIFDTCFIFVNNLTIVVDARLN